MEQNNYYQKLKEMEREIEDSLKGEPEEGEKGSLRDKMGELSSYDNHPGDLGAESFERTKDISLHEKRLMDLKRIKRAIAKIEEGGYGVCEGCGEDIDPSRLKVLPFAEYCITCAEKIEGSG